MKLAICGPGRSGKDVAADYLAEHFGFRYSGSTSVVISREVARRWETSFEAAHRMRHERRPLWHKVGKELRANDPAHLVREVLKDGDLVVGVRDRIEMETAIKEGLVDLVIWISRDVAIDPTLECGLEMADIIITNHGDIDQFHGRLGRLMRAMGRGGNGGVFVDAAPVFGDWLIGGVPVKSMNGENGTVPPTPLSAGDITVGPPPPSVLPSLGGVPRDSLTLYISGPMTGVPDNNFPAFNLVADVLRFRGWKVINPADFGDKPGDTWQSHLRRDLNLVMDCDVLVQLLGWEASKRATLEHVVAERLGKHIIGLADILNLG